jgi:hypothetical protein
LLLHTGYEIYNGEPWVTDLDSFQYNMGHMVEYHDYNLLHLELVINVISTYTYTDDLVTQIDHYGYRYGSWRNYLTETYEYSADGDVIVDSDTWGQEINYIYEPGRGNASLFFYLPTQRVYFRPTFKDATDSGPDGSDFLVAGIPDGLQRTAMDD